MEVFFVYIWLKLDDFIVFWRILAGCSMVAAFAFFVSFVDLYKDNPVRLPRAKRAFRAVVFAFVCVFISVLIPSSKETAVLVGTHYAVALRDSPEGVKVVSLLRKKANQFLDEQLKETQ